MSKVALVIHGWPQPMNQDHVLWKFFEMKGYRVVAPYLFEGEGVFDEAEVMKKIDESLGGEIPEVIAGISMGGLVALKLAQKYPRAKLILMATGARINSNGGGFELVWKAVSSEWGQQAVNLAAKIPDEMLANIYREINPFTGEHTSREAYEEDLRKNVQYVRQISLEKHLQIIDFIKNCDERANCKNIINQALILSGRQDPIMPLETGKELHQLLKNSRLHVSGDSHYFVINEAVLKEIDEFLEQE